MTKTCFCPCRALPPLPICATFKHELLERKSNKTGHTVELQEKHTANTLNTRRFQKLQKLVLRLEHTLVLLCRAFAQQFFRIATGDTHASQGSLDILVRSVHGIKPISRHLIWKRHQLTKHELRMADLTWVEMGWMDVDGELKPWHYESRQGKVLGAKDVDL